MATDRVFGSLSKFTQNALQIWDEEQKNERRRVMMAHSMPSYVLNAIHGKHGHGRRAASQRRTLPPISSVSQRSSSVEPFSRQPPADPPLEGMVQHHVQQRARSKTSMSDGKQQDTKDENNTLPTIYQLTKANDAPMTLSITQSMDWKHSFHHLHYEGKKRERIRRLEHIRLLKEANEREEVRLVEELREEKLQSAFEHKIEGITSAIRRIEQNMETLQAEEEVIRHRGVQRVHDKVRPSLLRQCGDTTPLIGEAVRLLPVNMVEDVYRAHDLVCPLELWEWTSAVGHVVEIKALQHAGHQGHSGNQKNHRTHHHHHGNGGHLKPPTSSLGVPRAAAGSRTPTTPGRTTPNVWDLPSSHLVPEEYLVVVRFGSITQKASKVFEIFASCLELAEDRDAVSAPMLITADGQIMELVAIDVMVEVVGDVAALTHRTSWVVPRNVQRQAPFVDIALVCPLVEQIQLVELSVDVGDSKLRTTVLDESDGAELVKSCLKARQFRIQQHQSRSDSTVGGTAANATTGGGKSMSAQLPIFSNDQITDPLVFVNEETSAAIFPTGFRALGVWQDAFATTCGVEPSDSAAPAAPLSSDNGDTFARSPRGGPSEAVIRVESIDERQSRVRQSSQADSSATSSSIADEGEGTSTALTTAPPSTPHIVKGALIPLKQHKVSELVHLQLKFQIEGTVTQRSAFSDGSVGTTPTQESVVDFAFPNRYPDACLNHKAKRNFEEISNFSVCVLGVHPRKVHIRTAPQTQIEPLANLNSAYCNQKHASSVVVACKKDVWRNYPIRVQVSQSNSSQSADLDFVAFVEPHPAVQMDFVVVSAVGPDVDRHEVSMRRLINVMIDSRSHVVRVRHAEEVYRMVTELVDRLESEDLISFSILQDHGWSFYTPHPDDADAERHIGGIPISARKTSLQSTPRTSISTEFLGTAGLKTQRASACWWRKQAILDAPKTFRDQWLEYLLHDHHRSFSHTSRGSHAVGLWLRNHQQLLTHMHPEPGKEDVREMILISGSSLDSEELQHIALQYHQGSHANVRLHAVMMLSPDAPNGLRRIEDPTVMLWQGIAQRSRGSTTCVHEGFTALRRMLSVVTALSGYVTCDMEVYVPSSTEVSILTPIFNLPSGGSMTVVAAAMYGGAAHSSSHHPNLSLLATSNSGSNENGSSATMFTSPLESVTVVAKLSMIRKLTKRMGLAKLPLGALSNILASRAVHHEMCLAWYTRQLQAAVEMKQQQSHGSNAPQLSLHVSGGGNSTTYVDVVEIACQLRRSMRCGPFGEAEAANALVALQNAAAQNSFMPTSPTAPSGAVSLRQKQYCFTGRSAALYLFNQLTSVNGSTAANAAVGPTSTLMSDLASQDRVNSTSGSPPWWLTPPTLFGQGLPHATKSWRDYSKQKCSTQLLEMGLFFRCPQSLFDLEEYARNRGPQSTITDGATGGSTDLLQWLLAQRDVLDMAISRLVAEESAIRGECEFVEWSSFLDAAKAFHTAAVSLQLNQLFTTKTCVEFAESERKQRNAIMSEEDDCWNGWVESTRDEMQSMSRYNKHLREARDHVMYDEEDARNVFQDDVTNIYRVLRLSVCTKPAPTTANVQDMLATIERFSKDDNVVELLCGALAAWTGSVTLHAQLLGQCGGITILKGMLQTYSASPRIVELCLFTLCNLSAVHVNQGKLEHSNIGADVLRVMEAHENDAQVQYRAMQCMGGVATLTNVTRQGIINAPNGLVCMLRRFPRWMSSRSYCVEAFRVFQALLSERQAHRFVAEDGLPQFVVAAMMLHSKDPKLDHYLLKIIRDACSDRVVRVILAVHAVVTRYILSVLSRPLSGGTVVNSGSSSSSPMPVGQNNSNSTSTTTVTELRSQPRERGGAAGSSSGASSDDSLLYSALKTVAKLCGNASDYPTMHLAQSLGDVLTSLNMVLCERPTVDIRCVDLIHTTLTRFSIANIQAVSPDAMCYDPAIRPLYKPWTLLESLDEVSDESYAGYPHPLACCYGKVKRSVLHVGNQSVECVMRVFSNVELQERLLTDHYVATTPQPCGGGSSPVHPGDLPAFLQLCRCALALQIQDAVENSMICSPHQLKCLGFSSHGSSHATIYAQPPRYTVRMILRAASQIRNHRMLLSAWLKLATTLTEVLLYYQTMGHVHGNLDLDHVFCEDDITQDTEPQFVVGPAVAIPPDIVAMVPPESQQTMFTKEEFEDVASRTGQDDDSDVRRALMEALLYGSEMDGEGDMAVAMKAIPDDLAQAVFALRPSSIPAGPCGTSSMFAKSPAQVREVVESYLAKMAAGTTPGISMRTFIGFPER